MLFVDDEEPIRELMCRYAARGGYDFTAVADGQEAIKLLNNSKDNPVTILITDLSMPGMDGMELLDYVEDHFPDLIAVLITGNDNIKHSKASLVVVKPFNCGEMLAKVAALAVK